MSGYSERFEEALVWAARLHREQTRKGKDVPYIHHLMAVASLVGSHGGDEDQVIAGLLHDAIEDCVGEVPDVAEQIGERFGERVREIVEGCTDAATDPKPPWRERKEAYLAHLRELDEGAPVLLVSLSDKVHNARSIVADLWEVGEVLWDRFNAGREGSLWYYGELAEIFGEKQPGYLSRELKALVEQMTGE
jgi:(p)ppGpp synthase/HD superfamily hydrolase